MNLEAPLLGASESESEPEPLDEPSELEELEPEDEELDDEEEEEEDPSDPVPVSSSSSSLLPAFQNFESMAARYQAKKAADCTKETYSSSTAKQLID